MIYSMDEQIVNQMIEGIFDRAIVHDPAAYGLSYNPIYLDDDVVEAQEDLYKEVFELDLISKIQIVELYLSYITKAVEENKLSWHLR